MMKKQKHANAMKLKLMEKDANLSRFRKYNTTVYAYDIFLPAFLNPCESKFALTIYDHEKNGIVDGLYMNHEFFKCGFKS